MRDNQKIEVESVAPDKFVWTASFWVPSGDPTIKGTWQVLAKGTAKTEVSARKLAQVALQYIQ